LEGVELLLESKRKKSLGYATQSCWQAVSNVKSSSQLFIEVELRGLDIKTSGNLGGSTQKLLLEVTARYLEIKLYLFVDGTRNRQYKLKHS
jgi:hypothetical protein